MELVSNYSIAMELIRNLIKAWASDTEDFLGFNVNTGIFDFEYSAWAVIENIDGLDQYFDEDGEDRDVLLENGGNIVLIPMDQLPIEKLLLLMKWWGGWGMKNQREWFTKKIDKIAVKYVFDYLNSDRNKTGFYLAKESNNGI